MKEFFAWEEIGFVTGDNYLPEGCYMKVQDFEGRQHNWPPSACLPKENDTRPRSEPHLRARTLLRSLYPCDRVYEEVPLPGTRLFADFFIPSRRMIVEVQGEQHFEYTPFFHGTKLAFHESQQRDAQKKEWCELNNLHLVQLPHDEELEIWQGRLR